MNADRRRRLRGALNALGDVRAIVQDVAEEEREAADNLMEYFEGTEKAEAAEASADLCEAAAASFDETDGAITEALGE